MTFEDLAASITNGVTPADEGAIAAFERRIGHMLPRDYRRFLTMSSGGYTDDSVAFTLFETQLPWNMVGGLRPEELYSLTHALEADGFGPLPRGLLWIGDDAGGNPIALNLRDDRFGEIFFIDHELLEDGEAQTIEAAEESGLATSLAPSFAASSPVSNLTASEARTCRDVPRRVRRRSRSRRWRGSAGASRDCAASTFRSPRWPSLARNDQRGSRGAWGAEPRAFPL